MPATLGNHDNVTAHAHERRSPCPATCFEIAAAVTGPTLAQKDSKIPLWRMEPDASVKPSFRIIIRSPHSLVRSASPLADRDNASASPPMTTTLGVDLPRQKEGFVVPNYSPHGHNHHRVGRLHRPVRRRLPRSGFADVDRPAKMTIPREARNPGRWFTYAGPPKVGSRGGRQASASPPLQKPNRQRGLSESPLPDHWNHRARRERKPTAMCSCCPRPCMTRKRPRAASLPCKGADGREALRAASAQSTTTMRSCV